MYFWKTGVGVSFLGVVVTVLACGVKFDPLANSLMCVIMIAKEGRVFRSSAGNRILFGTIGTILMSDIK